MGSGTVNASVPIAQKKLVTTRPNRRRTKERHPRSAANRESPQCGCGISTIKFFPRLACSRGKTNGLEKDVMGGFANWTCADGIEIISPHLPFSACHDRQRNLQAISVMAMGTDGRVEPQTHATHVFPRPGKSSQQHTVGPLASVDPDLRASILQCAAYFGTSDGFGSFRLEDESSSRNPLVLRRGRS